MLYCKQVGNLFYFFNNIFLKGGFRKISLKNKKN